MNPNPIIFNPISIEYKIRNISSNIANIPVVLSAVGSTIHNYAEFPNITINVIASKNLFLIIPKQTKDI